MRALRRIVLEEEVFATLFLAAVWYLYFVEAVWGLADWIVDGAFTDYVTGPGIRMEILLSSLGFGVAVAVPESRCRQTKPGSLFRLPVPA